ncbi:MAG: hypothetical protein JWO46_771 [Nocardioidaceae bacterium]|nr:hypothetical protein [Nocardioidaceae bacterium]
MNSIHRRTAVVVALAALPLALASTGAFAADAVLGEAPVTTTACGAGDFTLVQLSSSTTSYTVPSAGVITSVRLGGSNLGASSRAFKLIRTVATNTYTVVGATPSTSIAANQVLTQSARISAKAGDHLGATILGGGNCVTTGTGGDTYSGTTADSPVGGTFTNTTFAGLRLSAAVTLESDADGDGYGDTTQDLCSTSAVLHAGACNSLGKPSGKAKVGKRLNAPTVALPPGFIESFQWYRTFKKHHHLVVKSISGATAATYKAKRKDRGKKLFVRISASAAGAPTTSSDSGTKKIH